MQRKELWVPPEYSDIMAYPVWGIYLVRGGTLNDGLPAPGNNVIMTSTRQIWGIWKLRPALSPETPNLGQNQWCFVPCDLEIWWMTLENNRASLLCCFKLCAGVYTKFSGRLSEEPFPWLIQKFPCILIFKTGQPRCQLNSSEEQIKLDLTSGRPLV